MPEEPENEEEIKELIKLGEENILEAEKYQKRMDVTSARYFYSKAISYFEKAGAIDRVKKIEYIVNEISREFIKIEWKSGEEYLAKDNLGKAYLCFETAINYDEKNSDPEKIKDLNKKIGELFSDKAEKYFMQDEHSSLKDYQFRRTRDCYEMASIFFEKAVMKDRAKKMKEKEKNAYQRDAEHYHLEAKELSDQGKFVTAGFSYDCAASCYEKVGMKDKVKEMKKKSREMEQEPKKS